MYSMPEGWVPDGLGRWHKGLEGQLTIPDATWSVGGKPRVVSKPMYCYSHFFLICFVNNFVKFLFALTKGFFRILWPIDLKI